MAEPLALIGLLANAIPLFAKIGPYISAATHPPDIAARVQQEIDNTRLVVHALRDLIDNLPDGRRLRATNERLRMMYKCGCQLLCELENASQPLRSVGTSTVKARMKWTFHRKSLSLIVVRLEAFKGDLDSLLLILRLDHSRRKRERIKAVFVRILARFRRPPLASDKF